MNSKQKKRCLRAAGILLSTCMLGSSIAPGERAIFMNSIMMHASAFTANGVNYTVDTAEKRVIADNYTGTDKTITLATNSSYPISSYTYEIGDYVFNNNSTLEKVIVPNGYTSIGVQAFGCSNLKSVNLSEADTLKEIRKQAFNKCTKLSVLTMPEDETATLKLIGDEAFNGCSALTVYIYQFRLKKSETGLLKIAAAWI